MKKLLQKAAYRCGYKINRVSGDEWKGDPYRVLQKMLSKVKSPVIFDVGAHHGFVAQTFRDLFPDATIYAFEPFQESFQVLQANTQTNGVRALNYGLSDRSGRQAFHSNTAAVTNSLLPSDPQGASTWGEGLLDTHDVIDAEFRTLDQVMRELGLDRIDLLKMDVQGAEHMVLRGAARALAEKKIGTVYSEIIVQPTYQSQLRFDDALRAYYEGGLDLFNVYDVSFTAEGRLRQVDAIFTA